MENIIIIKAITGVNDSKANELNKLSNGDIDIAVNLYMKEIDNMENNNKYNDYSENVNENNSINKATLNIDLNEAKLNNDDLQFKIDIKRSLFDNNISKSFKSNLKYMKDKYGMTIPYEEYLLNIDNLFQYLNEEVYIRHNCIWCGKNFISFTSCCHHMIDKNHTKINFDLIENLEEYYNLQPIKEIYIQKDVPTIPNDLILPNGSIAIHKDMVDNYNKKNRIQLSTKKNIDQLVSQEIARKQSLANFHTLNLGMKHNKKAIASQFCHKENISFNKSNYAEKHHWGAGGGGSHYWLAASKQQLKGVSIKNIKQRRGGHVSSKNHQSGKQTVNQQ